MKVRPSRTARLPEPLSSFIGRERERREIAALVDEGRLLTLTGPGGAGKTRLAIEVAAGLGRLFSDGIFLVDLAPLRSAHLVPAAIARAVDVGEGPGRALEDTLAAALEGKHLLLVLDNFEHVLEAASVVRDLLERCSAVRALVTSREALRVVGEREYALAPLPVPPARAAGPENIDVSVAPGDAAKLFAERARAVVPEFRVTSENASVVDDICRALDGLPLAIELAAVRMRVLTPEGLLERLGHGLGVLGSPARGVPERQRTLRSAIGWSYDLLSPAEQRFFRQLAVFAGGCTLAAAEAVAGGAALDVLESLVAKSLVQRREVGGELRFTLLETVREYALAELRLEGEEGDGRGAHAAYCVGLAEEGERGLRGPEQQAWLDRLEREHDNLRSALSRLVEGAEGGETAAAEAAQQVAGAMWRFWHMRGHYGEGQAWLRRVLDLPGGGGPTAARALALYGAGFMLGSAALQTEGVEIQRRRGDRQGMAYALFGLGMALCNGRPSDEELARAEGALKEGLALYREVGDRFGEGWALTYLGLVAERRREREAARALHEDSLAIRREIGDLHGVATSLCTLGALDLIEGNTEAAERHLGEGVELWRLLGVRTRPVAGGIERLARLALDAGRAEAARALYRESAVLWRDMGNVSRAREAEAKAARPTVAAGGAARTGDTGEGTPAWASPAARGAGLSAREWEVLALLVAGGSTASMAAALGISTHTVVRHVSSILGKVGVSTRREAVARALGIERTPGVELAATLRSPEA